MILFYNQIPQLTSPGNKYVKNRTIIISTTPYCYTRISSDLAEDTQVSEKSGLSALWKC
jgi:hypothetical protein